jgi:transcription-repair coupling factor (superfamily II helicase)
MDQNQEKTDLTAWLESMAGRRQRIDCIGLQKTDKSYLIARLYQRVHETMVIIVPSPKEGRRICDELRFFLGSETAVVQYFPPYNLLPYQFLTSDSETAAERIRILYNLVVQPEPQLIVTTIDGVMKKTLPRKSLCGYAELILSGEEIDRELLVAKLESGGYEHTAIVEEPGDYCVRGGILDVFSPLYSQPLRIELFGDLVESLRFFSAVNQRTDKQVQEAVILPAKEAILDQSRLPEVIGRIREEASRINASVTTVRNIIDRLKTEGNYSGAENMLAFISPDLETLFDYTRSTTSRITRYVVTDHEAVIAAAETTQNLVQKRYQSGLESGGLVVAPENTYLSWEAVQAGLNRNGALVLKAISMLDEGKTSAQTLDSCSFNVEDNTELIQALKHSHSSETPLKPLVDWVNDYRDRGYLTLVACAFPSQAERLKALLLPYAIPTAFKERFPNRDTQKKYRKNPLFLCVGEVSSGFVWPNASIALITANEIFGTRRKGTTSGRTRVQKQLLRFEDLKHGDLVVHDEHGIGQYKGLIKLTVAYAINEYLLIVYKHDDRLYLPVDRMNRIQKYLGVDGVVPVLDKMGGKTWDRVKEKAKKSTIKIAKELLKIYAARKVHKGFSHRPVETELQDFENGFPFEETPDQMKVIERVLHDMAQPLPMDRLVCGDVGYGKTEVALRAAFVSVFNSKQVAVLVPTTVLAEQHFTTFSERFKDYPVHIACLSRFRSRKEQRNIVQDLKEGKVDIVIGTHRILQKDVVFKDLGLFVLDEEHRFGVRHKETLKKIRTTVDVLALTATPIPRTLHMSLVGIRDIDLIATPPEYRHAVVTYVSEFTDGIVKDAVTRELQRGGQIFFVHNAINSIERMAAHIKRIVPDIRLDIAHGQMPEHELEKIMLRFINKEIDMLVCTTIIESGLDIPSANTIFINRADRFGLAQMYQLRGRVGRAEERAYAYLFIPPESYITRDALKRLKVLMDHNDLGSGFQIAMSDLKIRGGGTILGASQSGHIAAVGYDMFLKLMEESVAELKGEQPVDEIEPEINLPQSAFIPENFIADIDQRLAAYRRLSRISKVDELSVIKDEFIDRYGKLPEEVSNLFLRIVFKVLARKAGIKKLDVAGNRLVLHISDQHQVNPHGLIDLIMSDTDRFRLTPDHKLMVALKDQDKSGIFNQTKYILKEIAHHVNA